MRKSRFTTEQIIGFIQHAKAGMAVSEMGRRHGLNQTSSYAWHAKCGGLETEDAKRPKEHQSQNVLLKQLLVEAHVDIEAPNAASIDRDWPLGALSSGSKLSESFRFDLEHFEEA